MELWKCTGCNQYGNPCYMFDKKNIVYPACPVGYTRAEWQKTTDFEIVEKKKVMFPDFSGATGVLKTDYPELAKRMEPQTPNCAVCEWANDTSKGTSARCRAQASITAVNVYGNENCITLFKEKSTT